MGLWSEQRKAEEWGHNKRIADITREFITSKYLQDFYNETLKEQDNPMYEGSKTIMGIGQGHYYPTIRDCIEDALYQLFEADWETIREHQKLYGYILDTVTIKLKDETEWMDNIEDYISPRNGNEVVISADLDVIFKNILKEMETALTNEMIELFVTAVKKP